MFVLQTSFKPTIEKTVLMLIKIAISISKLINAKQQWSPILQQVASKSFTCGHDNLHIILANLLPHWQFIRITPKMEHTW